MAQHSYDTKAERVLRHIAAFPDGRTLKEIQTYILVMNGHQKWLERGYLRFNHETFQYERTHAGRGYWCDYLYGLTGPYRTTGRAGLLHKYCTKLPTGRYIVTEPIKGPWRRMDKPTKTYIANADRWAGAYKRYVDALPKCPSCGHAIFKYSRTVMGGQACLKMSGMTHSVDCQDRVWRVDDMNTSYNRQTYTLTSLKPSDVVMIESIARKMTPGNWEGQKVAIWNELGEHLAKDGN